MKMLKTFLSLTGLVFCLIAFQNCSDVAFSKEANAAGKSDSFGEPLLVDETAPAPIEVSENEGDGEGDVECIGNGIKVPAETVIACTDGSIKCLVVCKDNETLEITFEEGRTMIPGGAAPGICL